MLSGLLWLGVTALIVWAAFATLPPGWFDSYEAHSTDIAVRMRHQLALNVITTPISLAGNALFGIIQVGVAHMTLKLARGEALEIADVFWGFTRPWQSMLVGLITMIGLTIGWWMCILPGFIIGGLLMTAIPHVADRGEGVFAAIGWSCDAMWPHVWFGALLFFLFELLSGLGLLACCIGYVFTWPWMTMMQTLVYRELSAPEPSVPPCVAAPGPAAEAGESRTQG